MNELIMMLFGAGMGAAVFLALRALRPRPTPLHDLFALLDGAGETYRSENTPRGLRGVLTDTGMKITTASSDINVLRQNLSVTGRPMEQHALQKVALPAAVVLLAYVLWMVMTFAGLTVPMTYLLFAVLIGVPLAFIWPDLSLKSEAADRRRAFRHSLSAYLDLVTIIVAGGAGLNSALTAAADAGDGWAFGEIRTALNRARLSNQAPWATLEELGDRFNVAELGDLVATVSLAGDQGAKAEESIATKAEVLRGRLLSELEALSEERTEKMLVPVGLLMLALFLFIGFAVYMQLNGGRSPVA